MGGPKLFTANAEIHKNCRETPENHATHLTQLEVLSHKEKKNETG